MHILCSVILMINTAAHRSRRESGRESVYLISLVPAVSMSAILICQTTPLKSADVLLTGISKCLPLQKVLWWYHGTVMVSDIIHWNDYNMYRLYLHSWFTVHDIPKYFKEFHSIKILRCKQVYSIYISFFVLTDNINKMKGHFQKVHFHISFKKRFLIMQIKWL